MQKSQVLLGSFGTSLPLIIIVARCAVRHPWLSAGPAHWPRLGGELGFFSWFLGLFTCSPWDHLDPGGDSSQSAITTKLLARSP